MDDDFGGGVAFGDIYDTLASFPPETAVLSEQVPALSLVSRTLLPPFVTAIAGGEDGEDEGDGGGEFERL